MQDKQHGYIGINIFSFYLVPLTDSIEDEIASQRANDFYIGWYVTNYSFFFFFFFFGGEIEIATLCCLRVLIDSVLCNRFWNPLIFGDYPDVMKKNAGSRIPAFTIEESDSIRCSFDSLGLNYYNVMHVKDKSSILRSQYRDANADMEIKLYRVHFLHVTALHYNYTAKNLSNAFSTFLSKF